VSEEDGVTSAAGWGSVVSDTASQPPFMTPCLNPKTIFTMEKPYLVLYYCTKCCKPHPTGAEIPLLPPSLGPAHRKGLIQVVCQLHPRQQLCSGRGRMMQCGG
jgi:hypothetical protein